MNERGTGFASLFEYYGFTEADEKNYPVISRILKELTPERIEQEIREVAAVELPPQIQEWAEEYERLGERNEFFWKWVFRGIRIFAGDRTERQYLQDLLLAKMLIFMMDGLLDDITDKYRDEKLLNEAIKVPFAPDHIEYSRLSNEERRYIDFAISIWNRMRATVERFPRFREFSAILDYDVRQLLNALEYCHLVHRNNHLYNSHEAWTYLPHGMQVMTNITLELTCSPRFNMAELGKLRRAAWHAQGMARIGNWVSTWEREIHEEDYTSAVFIHAIENEVINLEDLLHEEARLNAVTKIRGSEIEKGLLVAWEENHREIDTLSRQIESIDVREMLSALKRVIVMHLSSRGHK